LRVLRLWYGPDENKVSDSSTQSEANDGIESEEACLAVGVILTDIGNVYRKTNVYDKALDTYKSAIKLYDKIRLDHQHPRVLATSRAMSLVTRSYHKRSASATSCASSQPGGFDFSQLNYGDLTEN